jgi:hypothetical protein
LKYSTSMDYITKQIVYIYCYDGELTLSGKVNLQLSEPFTSIKVWVKSVPIEPTMFYVKSHYKYKDKNIPVTDFAIWNTVVENLKLIYGKSLKTPWDHLDPEELKVKKSEAAEIKKSSRSVKKIG